MSPILKRKLNVFFSQKKAKVGLFVFGIFFLIMLFANLISNNKPYFIYREAFEQKGEQVVSLNKKKLFFPILFDYSPDEFGIADAFIINFKELIKKDKEENRNIIYLFPPNKWDPEEQTDNLLSAPSAEHWLGTDNLGRDVTARLVYGIRISLSFAFILWILSYSIGVTIGAMQGYFLGKFDFILERFKELSSIIPTLTIVILVTAITKSQSFWMIVFVILIFGWMGIASQIRASVLSLRKREFCEASHAMGGGTIRVLFKHILPNSLTPIITFSPFAIEGGVSLLAVLDYLGFGLPPPTPSIGELMSQGKDNIQNAPWVLISPVISILLLLISVSLVGQAIRKAFDPRG